MFVSVHSGSPPRHVLDNAIPMAVFLIYTRARFALNRKKRAKVQHFSVLTKCLRKKNHFSCIFIHFYLHALSFPLLFLHTLHLHFPIFSFTLPPFFLSPPLLFFLPYHYRITTVSATIFVPSQFPRSSLAVPLQYPHSHSLSVSFPGGKDRLSAGLQTSYQRAFIYIEGANAKNLSPQCEKGALFFKKIRFLRVKLIFCLF